MMCIRVHFDDEAISMDKELMKNFWNYAGLNNFTIKSKNTDFADVRILRCVK